METVKRSVRLPFALVFDSLFPIMVLTAFAAGGIFPLHYGAIIIGVALAIISMVVSNVRQAGILMIATVFIAALLTAGWSVLPLMALSVYFVWRLLVRTYHYDSYEITTIQLILLMVVFLATYSFQLTYEIYSPAIIVISLVAGFILYSASPYFSSFTGKKALKLFGKWSALFLGCSMLIYFLIAPVKQLFITGTNQLINLITNFFEYTGINVSIPEISQEETETSEEGVPPEFEIYPDTETEDIIRVDTIEVVITIIAAIILLFIVVKAFKKFGNPVQTVKQVNEEPMLIKNDVKQPAKEKITAPNHAIRKEMLKLERKAQAKDAGRRKSETVREWFTRLNVRQAQAMAMIYEKIRYADEEITESEHKAFEQFVKDFEKRI
ncbi:hypothetical protein JMA_14850 [Jeotgalibacillus malaysiensis]|uniref:DUF4129 domain-containing protein n=1 Tax=Jeotgalibacillus malaysiensis TaxID=1508404 RepID=A0A0B5AQ75_9BACL|nr:DUF4129 domain-containing protein [Jeotgalibacillus malaysiensis]AJD90802.1 hypothetical protein JMA_14850 [Jeotgalibacillus malaysiensis]